MTSIDLSITKRILIVGGSGTGKTTMARQLAEMTGLPAHHLDEIARVGGGTGPEKSPQERAEGIRRILASGAWVSEGIHLGWTEPLMEAADVIIWLDHLCWTRSSKQIVRRFITNAMAEASRQSGRRKFTRFRDYKRRLLELVRAVPEVRAYHRVGPSQTGPSHAATTSALEPYRHKLVWCHTSSDIDRVIDSFAGHQRMSRGDRSKPA